MAHWSFSELMLKEAMLRPAIQRRHSAESRTIDPTRLELLKIRRELILSPLAACPLPHYHERARTTGTAAVRWAMAATSCSSSL